VASWSFSPHHDVQQRHGLDVARHPSSAAGAVWSTFPFGSLDGATRHEPRGTGPTDARSNPAGRKPREELAMIVRISTIALAMVLATGLNAALAQTPGTGADKAATAKATAAKKADCKRQAKAQHFGIHLIKRNRYIDECMKRS
jgi:hypothetical protein